MFSRAVPVRWSSAILLIAACPRRPHAEAGKATERLTNSIAARFSSRFLNVSEMPHATSTERRQQDLRLFICSYFQWLSVIVILAGTAQSYMTVSQACYALSHF
jgi:hypothetical protein